MIDLIWFTKNSKNKSILALLITLLFALLHMLLWFCIYYKLGFLDMIPIIYPDHRLAETSHALLKLTTSGIFIEVVCIIISLMAIFGLRKEFDGRHYLYAWMFGMVVYLLLGSLISWCFIYWAYKRQMITFILVTSIAFWAGRTTVLVGCILQISSHFSSVVKPDIPTIVVEAEPSVPSLAAPKIRSPSVATVSTIVSNVSNPDAQCEKQYPGYLPYSIDFNTMYPSYLFDEYDPATYPPEFMYDYNQYAEYPQNLVSPSYEEATASASHCPPPYTTADNLYPPSYTEADQNLVASAQALDSTTHSGLLHSTPNQSRK